MLTKSKIAFAAALILAPASIALASDSGEPKGGGPVQTWQDVQRSAQIVQDQIRKAYKTNSPGSAYGYVVPNKKNARKGG